MKILPFIFRITIVLPGITLLMLSGCAPPFDFRVDPHFGTHCIVRASSHQLHINRADDMVVPSDWRQGIYLLAGEHVLSVSVAYDDPFQDPLSWQPWGMSWGDNSVSMSCVAGNMYEISYREWMCQPTAGGNPFCQWAPEVNPIWEPPPYRPQPADVRCPEQTYWNGYGCTSR